MYKYLTFLLAIISFSYSFCCESYIPESTEDSQTNIERRIDLDPELITINEDGIFLITASGLMPISQILFDGQHLYTFMKMGGSATDMCPNGHKIYHWACMGCAHWWCVFRCKCCSPW